MEQIIDRYSIGERWLLKVFDVVDPGRWAIGEYVIVNVSKNDESYFKLREVFDYPYGPCATNKTFWICKGDVLFIERLSD